MTKQLSEINHLEKQALFHKIPPEEIQKLLRCFHACVKCYPKDSYIRRRGDKADFIGVVLQGELQMSQDDTTGKRILVATFGQGCKTFGETFSCCGYNELLLDLYATTDCEILFLNQKDVLGPCSNSCMSHQQILLNLIGELSRKDIMLHQKLRILSHSTTAEKLMAYLAEQEQYSGSPEFIIPYNRQELADFLGVERSAMCTEISKLQKQGRLITRKNYFKLLHADNE